MKISAKNRKFNKNWMVRVYKQSHLIDSFEIKNSYEWEAAETVHKELSNKINFDDYTITPK